MDMLRTFSDSVRQGIGYKPQKFKVYYESFLIGVDKHAHTCITNNTNHFIGQLRPIKHRVVKGYWGYDKVQG